MQPLKAQVRKGRLVLDVPTELPEGEIVELVRLEEVRFGDDLDPEERARLHQSLRTGIEQMKAGDTVDGEEVLAELRAEQ